MSTGADRLDIDRRGSVPDFGLLHGGEVVAPGRTLANRTEHVMGIDCQRCNRTHWVDEQEWRESMGNPTRPCPYCFKVSRVPDAATAERDLG